MMGLRVAPLEPLGEALLEAIGESLRHGYGIEVEQGIALGEPGFAWDGTRKQHNAPLILRHLLNDVLKGAPDDVRDGSGAGPARLLAVTGRDLYIPMLSFVYGQAQLGGRVAVVSMARLRPEFYGLPPDEELLHIRARKEALHEVGHLLGLIHCPDASCAMALATGIRQLDHKQPSLCAGCAALAIEGRNAARKGK
jgi:archaemetzincin